MSLVIRNQRTAVAARSANGALQRSGGAAPPPPPPPPPRRPQPPSRPTGPKHRKIRRIYYQGTTLRVLMGTRTVHATVSSTNQIADWFGLPAGLQMANESPMEMIAVVLPWLTERRLITRSACQAVIEHIRAEQREKVIIEE